jgi:ATP-binding cassette subfamily B protein
MRYLLRLLGYLKPYWGRAVLAYGCLLTVTALNLVVPWLIKEVIDVGLADQTGRVLVLAALAVIGVTAGKAIFAFGQQYLMEWLSQRVAYDVRNDLYDHLQRLSFSYHDKAQTGQLMSRATSDVDAVRVFTGIGLLQIVNITLLSIAISFVLFSMHPRLALLAILPIPVLAARAVSFGRTIRPIFLRLQQKWADLTTVLQENLAGVRVVRAFAQEDYELEKFDKENIGVLERNLEAVRKWSFNFPLMSFLVSLGTVLILWFGGREVVAGRLSVGTLVAFNSYLVMLAGPVRQLGWIVNLLARAMASGERIFEILDTPQEVREVPQARKLPPLRGQVRFEHVTFSYDSGAPVLKDVDLEAQPGQVIALLGLTGSGKSTIINLIPRFYDVSAGRILVDGYDIREVALPSLRRQIGIVLQETLLFSATVRENIAYGRTEASQEEIEAAAKAAHAHEFIIALPQGYETRIGERGVTLSGGQKQRLAIARALLMDPRLLILDDSTSSVDTETEYLIQQALARLMEGRTTFVIAQRLTTILRADQILVLQDGEIVQRGRHEELLAQGGLYREIYDLQLRDQEERRRAREARVRLGLEEEEAEERAEAWRRPAFAGAMAGMEMEG